MHSYRANILTIAITCTLLIILFAVTLCKAYHGTRYTFVLWLVSLLLVSNVGYLVNVIAFYKVNNQSKKYLYGFLVAFG